MVSDALRGVADAYFLLSNDSDFVEALRIVRERSGSEIGLDVPTETSPAGALLDVRRSTCVRRTSARVSSRHDGVGGFGMPSARKTQEPRSDERGS